MSTTSMVYVVTQEGVEWSNILAVFLHPDDAQEFTKRVESEPLKYLPKKFTDEPYASSSTLKIVGYPVRGRLPTQQAE